MGKSNGKQRCPKCGGNMFLYNDHDGWYEQCLQCAFTYNLEVAYKKGTIVKLKRPVLNSQNIAG